jgi:hypothetical protein
MWCDASWLYAGIRRVVVRALGEVNVEESVDRQGYCFGSTLASVIDQGGTNCLHMGAANHLTSELGCLHSANSSTKLNACRPRDLRPHAPKTPPPASTTSPASSIA